MIEQTQTLENSDEFLLRLSGLQLLFKWLIQSGAFYVFALSVWMSCTGSNRFEFLNGMMNGGIIWLFTVYVLLPFPRKVSSSGDEIFFHKMPTAWVTLMGAPIPISATTVLARQKATVELEWVGKALTLNDMENGRSIRLASGRHAAELASWLKAHGVSNFVGG
ncbi:MAG: hypothetical protein P4L36_04640 [Holophaga sp.]|nr:hypothetical protein [Holophaga sp.]